MISEKLEMAVELIKAGKKTTAVPILKEILKENPKDENAWLWLYYCAEDTQYKKFYVRQVLEINPNNPQAIKAWNKLNSPQPLLPPPHIDKAKINYLLFGLTLLTLLLCTAIGASLMLLK